jgi:hypothetical protein
MEFHRFWQEETANRQPDERVNISSVANFWKLLGAVLEAV